MTGPGLRLETLTVPAADIGPVNPLPPLTGPMDPHQQVQAPFADPEMAANLDYGRLDSVLPYLAQDGYTRDRRPTDLAVAVLENDVLRATFLLDYGGRLWSLVHRPTGRELLHRNAILQPANLALRNAWFAGGVEWNIGATGHTPLTCAPVHAARVTRADGTPVLRLYEWERIRELSYCVEAWLPPGSPVLLVHVRVVNPRRHETPMYWWSNTAVPETPDVRVICPADSAYHIGDDRRLRTVGVPDYDGADVSYPARAGRAADYFFDARSADRPWIAALDGAGVGLAHVSTGRLIGRKLFVWGRSTGGRRWQEFLSGPHAAYTEIQAGLARTQLEHLRMPGGARWSWVEAYGLLQADPRQVHGPWAAARRAVGVAVDALAPSSSLDRALADAESAADDPPEQILHAGSGWGALEHLRRARAHEEAVDLPGTPYPDDTLGAEQEPWVRLLETGWLPPSPPDEPPASYVVGPAWQALLERTADGWLSWLHRGVARWQAGDRAGARLAWESSLAEEPTPWAMRNLGVAAIVEGDPTAGSRRLLSAHRSAPGIRSLTIETVQALLAACQPDEVLAVVDDLGPADRSDGRIRAAEAWAAVERGDLDRAGGLLADGIELADLREGERSLDELWFAYHEARAAAETGHPVDQATRERIRRAHPLPPAYDFRMT
jgi:hypothetical protein